MRHIFVSLLSILCLNVVAQADVLPVYQDSITVFQDALESEQIDTLGVNQAETKEKENFFVKFFKGFNNYDTNYIEPNHYNFSLMMLNSNMYQTYVLGYKGIDDKDYSIRVSPKPSLKVGPYFGWRWLFVGYTFDVSGKQNVTKTHEFSLSLYSSQVGLDFLYVNSKGDCTIKSVSGFDDYTSSVVTGQNFAGVSSYIFGLNLYYVFNHNHFSYPAAYSQSTVQRISCGSWMLGLRYDHQHTTFDYSQLPLELQPTIPTTIKSNYSRVVYRNYSISFGYGYNWVFARNMLFNLSLMPSVGYKQREGAAFQRGTIIKDVRNFNIDLISRAAVVWNNTHWYCGLSYVGHLYNFREQKYSLINNVNYLYFYVGFNFLRRKN